MCPTRMKLVGVMVLASLVLGLHAAAPPVKAPSYLGLLKGDKALEVKELRERIEKLMKQDRYAEAAKEAKRLLELRRRVQGATHWEAIDTGQEVITLERLSRLPLKERQAFAQVAGLIQNAMDLRARGKYAQVQPLLEKALAVCRKVVGEEHPDTAASYNNLAFNLDDQGKYALAQPFYEKALAIRKKVLGEEHPTTAQGYNNAASNLNLRGKYVEARRLFEKALLINRRVLGEEHSSTAQSYNNLATNLDAQGKYAEAQSLHVKALLITRKLMGEEHPSTASCYNNVAFNLNARGKYAQAQPLFEKALAIRKKVLGEEHRNTASSYANLATNLDAQARYAQAQPLHEKALAIRRKVLGEEHPDTASIYGNLGTNLNAQGRYAQAQPLLEKAAAIKRKVLGEEHPDTATAYNNLANNLNVRGKYAQAQPLYEKALAIRKKVLGEEHPHTATSYNNLASCLDAQARYAQAQPLHEKALVICRKLLGEEHSDTAVSFGNLAHNLNAQGKYVQAQPLHVKALLINRKALGDEHSRTAICYHNLATNLNSQGKYAQAQPLFEKALVIFRKVLGEDHPHTATTYHSVAHNLNAQGKYAQAQLLHERALAISRKVMGEEHPLTARSCNHLAYNLSAQGKHAQAQLLYQKALLINRHLLGEVHPDTITNYSNLATTLNAQDKYAEAQPLLEKALAIFRKMLGEEHPHTATSYNNLASNLSDQGKYADAQPLLVKALSIKRKAQGEGHPDTVSSYNNLALLLNARGKYADTEKLLARSLPSYLRIRLNIARPALARARFVSSHSPLDLLAALLARRGQSRSAWLRLEQALAQSTLDELTTRLRYTPQQQERLQQLAHRLRQVDQQLERCPATAEGNKQRQELLTQQRQLLDEQDAFFRVLDRQYGPLSGQVFSLADIQKSLPADAALLAWLDLKAMPNAADPRGDHWAVLLRGKGDPIWVRLHGTGPNGAWARADTGLSYRLYQAMQNNAAGWRELARRLRRLRFEPLLPHLKAGKDLPAVRRLIVLPSPALDGVPVGVLAEDHIVSYALSGTLHAHLRQLPRPSGREALLLADPAFNREPPPKRPLVLPPHGLLVRQVLPGSSAAKAFIRPGDVLLRYGGVDLESQNDLRAQLAANVGAKKRLLLGVWRDGKERLREVQPGPLGVVLAARPAREELASQHEADRLLARLHRGKSYAPLPGARVEVAALQRLVKDSGVTLLVGPEASEQKLDEMARKDQLKRYRFLHLATHGEADLHVPLQSHLILAQGRLPKDTGRLLELDRPVHDGRLTVEEVLRSWKLSSELVTLSACQTSLGRYERSEGYLGFAQAMLLSGSRSVCLSLWQVDDTATALLMERFYQNLLGKRVERHGGLSLQKPLGKAEALSEAKRWLRELPLAEAVKHAAALTAGVPRKPNEGNAPARAWQKGKPGSRPFAHPYYWAAFVLIGHDE